MISPGSRVSVGFVLVLAEEIIPVPRRATALRPRWRQKTRSPRTAATQSFPLGVGRPWPGDSRTTAYLLLDRLLDPRRLLLLHRSPNHLYSLRRASMVLFRHIWRRLHLMNLAVLPS